MKPGDLITVRSGRVSLWSAPCVFIGADPVIGAELAYHESQLVCFIEMTGIATVIAVKQRRGRGLELFVMFDMKMGWQWSLNFRPLSWLS
jgi:hypothetical protein